MHVDERQALALRPEAPQDVSAAAHLVEGAAAHAVGGDPVARRDRVVRRQHAHPGGRIADRPLGDADRDARHRGERGARRGRLGPGRPAQRAHPGVEVARQVGHHHQRVEAEEPLGEKRERGEDRAHRELHPVEPDRAPAPHQHQRPRREQHGQTVPLVEGPVDGPELADDLEDRLVPPEQEVLEGLPQRAPAERVDERHRQRRDRHLPQRARAGAGQVGLDDVDAEQQQAEVVGDVAVRPDPGDRDDPGAAIRSALAPRLEDPNLEPHQDRDPGLGPDLRALPVGERGQHDHHEHGEPARADPPRDRPQDRERGERGDPAPREQAGELAPLPERPHQRLEAPRAVDVGRPVGGPRPDLGGRDAQRLPHDLPDQQVLPEIGVVDEIGDGEQDARGGDRRDHQRPWVGGRERRDRLARLGSTGGDRARNAGRRGLPRPGAFPSGARRGPAVTDPPGHCGYRIRSAWLRASRRTRSISISSRT